MSESSESTILHYRQRAFELACRYESIDVSDLQKTLRDTFDYRSRILELGCGSGRDAAFLKRFGNIREITVTDASPEMLTEAARIHPEIAGNLEELVLPHGLMRFLHKREKYNGIFCVAALMHLTADDIIETLRYCELLLDSGGILFISVPASRPDQEETDPRLFTMLPEEWWRTQLDEAGMKVVEILETADGLNRPGYSWLNITAVK